jgi:flagellar motor switch protein FliG
MTSSPASSLTGPQKAAILLVCLGQSASGQILKLLGEDGAERISAEIARLNTIEPNHVEGVLAESERLLSAHRSISLGGMDSARKLLVEAFGPEQANRLIDRLTKAMGKDPIDLEVFRKSDPQQLAKFLQDEHPQTMAVVLSYFDPTQAAAVLAALPLELRSDVVKRMATLDQVSPEIVKNVTAVIGQKLRALGQMSRESCGGVRAVADIVNRLDSTSCAQLLGQLEQSEPELFENIRRFMFVFEDLSYLPVASMRVLLSKVESKTFQLALKGTSEKLRDLVFSSLSTRAADMFKEDMEALGPVRIRDVDAAQQQIIAVAQELDKEGQIALKGSAADELIA